MIVAPLILGAALFFFTMEMWARRHTPPASAGAREDPVFVDRFSIADTGVAVPAVGRYLEFVAFSPSQGGLIHNYINRGTRLIFLSLRGLSEYSVRVTPVENMQVALGRYVDSLESHPRWSLDPRRVRQAFLMSVELMGSLNLKYDPVIKARIDSARVAATAMDPDISTIAQRPKVQEFFIRAGEALVALKEKAARPGTK